LVHVFFLGTSDEIVAGFFIEEVFDCVYVGVGMEEFEALIFFVDGDSC